MQSLICALLDDQLVVDYILIYRASQNGNLSSMRIQFRKIEIGSKLKLREAPILIEQHAIYRYILLSFFSLRLRLQQYVTC
jgi:hypothetical protein